MDYEKLIERLKCPQIHSCPMKGDYPSCKAYQKDIKQDAADALTALLAENARLKHYEEKCHDCPIVCAKTEIIKAHEKLGALQVELEQVKRERDTAVETIYTLLADCPPEVCREICANHDGICSKHAEMSHYDHCKGFKWVGEKED